jgi:hypothetical protein
MKMTSMIRTSIQQTVIEVTRGRRLIMMIKILLHQMIKQTRTPSHLSSLLLLRSCKNPRQRPPSKRMMMKKMMGTSTLSSLLRRTRVMTLVWTTNSKTMKSESRGLKSRTLRRSKSLSSSPKERNSISRITSKGISSSSVRVAGEAVEVVIKAETIKIRVIMIEEKNSSRGMRGPSNNILLKQETGPSINLDQIRPKMIVKETHREIMEKIEVEEAIKVNTSPVVVKEVAAGTMATIGEVREVVIEEVANINNVEEVEAIAMTTNFKVL